MYAVGDYIVYGNSGVCEVTDITKRENPLDGSICDYYVLTPLSRKGFSTGTIYTPAENPKVFMRPVISADEANEIIDRIPSMTAEVYHNVSTQQLVDHYQQIMHTHDCGNLIQLVMSIHAKREYAAAHKRTFGRIDSEFMTQAEDLINTEFSIALSIPKEKVNDYIADRVGTRISG